MPLSGSPRIPSLSNPGFTLSSLLIKPTNHSCCSWSLPSRNTVFVVGFGNTTFSRFPSCKVDLFSGVCWNRHLFLKRLHTMTLISVLRNFLFSFSWFIYSLALNGCIIYFFLPPAQNNSLSSILWLYINACSFPLVYLKIVSNSHIPTLVQAARIIFALDLKIYLFILFFEKKTKRDLEKNLPYVSLFPKYSK